MTLLFFNPICLEHDTGGHPECANRIYPAAKMLRQFAGQAEYQLQSEWSPLNGIELAAVHRPELIHAVRRLCERGGGRLDEDTVVSPQSFDVAAYGAGAVVRAVDDVLGAVDRRAFCLVRPPGHHASADRAMGFCLFNNISLGARHAIARHGLDRVLIVDWDVHHGNGTQDIFWRDGQVGFLSLHRDPFYPGTGAADETGAGPGLGTTLNVPLQFGVSRGEYLRHFRQAVETMNECLRPQLILISAGFDAHGDDPIGSLGLESEDFAVMTQIVQEAADVWAGGRIVSVLEGGYHPAALGECVQAHLSVLG